MRAAAPPLACFPGACPSAICPQSHGRLCRAPGGSAPLTLRRHSGQRPWWGLRWLQSRRAAWRRLARLRGAPRQGGLLAARGRDGRRGRRGHRRAHRLRRSGHRRASLSRRGFATLGRRRLGLVPPRLHCNDQQSRYQVQVMREAQQAKNPDEAACRTLFLHAESAKKTRCPPAHSAAPRSLQTLAVRRFNRAASGRLLKTLGLGRVGNWQLADWQGKESSARRRAGAQAAGGARRARPPNPPPGPRHLTVEHLCARRPARWLRWRC